MPLDDLDAVLALERELQSAGTRADPARLRELLAESFVEVGASGRRWDKAAILDLLDAESASGDPDPIEVIDLHGRHLTDDLIQVFWDSHHAGRRARRTSLWQRDESGWRQVYHQGTPLERSLLCAHSTPQPTSFAPSSVRPAGPGLRGT